MHHREDEAFYVIEGEYEFLVGGEALRAEAGSLLYVPKGTLHTHTSVGADAGRMLVTQTPGGLYKRFFEEARQETRSGAFLASLEEGSPEAAKIAELAARYGIEIAILGRRDNRSWRRGNPTQQATRSSKRSQRKGAADVPATLSRSALRALGGSARSVSASIPTSCPDAHTGLGASRRSRIGPWD